MGSLKMFLLGFGFWYVLQLVDILMQIIGSYTEVVLNKNQKKINDMFGEEVPEKALAIGFQYIPDIEYYNDWENE